MDWSWVKVLGEAAKALTGGQCLKKVETVPQKKSKEDAYGVTTG